MSASSCSFETETKIGLNRSGSIFLLKVDSSGQHGSFRFFFSYGSMQFCSFYAHPYLYLSTLPKNLTDFTKQI